MTHAGRAPTTRWWLDVGRLALIFGFQPNRRNVLHWLSWAFALGLEFALIGLLRDGRVYLWEIDLTRLLQRLPTRDVYLTWINVLTNTLSMEFLLLFAAIVTTVFLLGQRLDALLLLVTFPVHVLAQFPKALIDRPRPSPAFDGIEGVGGVQSFPSGHAEFVISFWGFLTLLAWLHLKERWQRIAFVSFWIALALLTGLLRIAMGRHWPIDIFASYIFGFGILSGLIWLRRSIRLAIATVDLQTSEQHANKHHDQEP